MEHLSANPQGATFNERFNLYEPGKWSFATFEFSATPPTLALNDFLTFFSTEQLNAYRISDWFVKSQQLDSAGTPTLKINVGFGDGSGVSGTNGYRFASDRDFGGPALGSVLRCDTFGSELQNAPSVLRLGISIAALPTTPALANKRLVMGILLQPVLFSK